MKERSTLLSAALICFIASSINVSCASDPGQTPSSSPDLRITHSLEQWFTALAREPLASQPTDEVRLDFALLPASPVAPEDLQRWLVDLRPDHPQTKYRLAALSISPVDSPPPSDTEYDTRFALERDTVDDAGVPHVARWEQHWRIRLPAAGAPVVVSIDEEPRLIFPGTGPQIVCF